MLDPAFGLVSQSLESLLLVQCDLSKAVFKKAVVKNLKHMKDLYELDLSHNDLGQEPHLLLGSLHKELNNLETFSAVGCGFRDMLCLYPAMKEEGMGLSNLLRLDLSNSFDDPDQVRVLAESPCMESLKFLKLKNCCLNNASAEILLSARYL